MAKSVDYYLSLNSPYAYLGSKPFTELVERFGATVNVYPVQYGKIFPASGGLPLPKRAPQRKAYRLIELARWRDFRGVPMNIEPTNATFDQNLAVGTVIAARERGDDALALSNAFLAGLWVDDSNLADPKILRETIAGAGFDADALLTAAQDPKMMERYDADTDRAIEIGVFGAPTYIVDGEMFWGQDRLDFIERKLQG